MFWSSSETAIIVLAGEDEVDCLLSGQGVWLSEQVKSSQAPIDAVQSQMLCEPVLQLILTLSVNERRLIRGIQATYGVEASDICDVLVDNQAQLVG